jgi:hypothetical protein
MLYNYAIFAARTAAGLIIAAASYYGLRQLMRVYPIRAVRDRLNLLRQIHPWIGAAILLVIPIHISVMVHSYLPDGMSPKLAAGMLLGLALIVQSVAGSLLKINPARVKLRLVHRGIMFFILVLLVVHKLVRLG